MKERLNDSSVTASNVEDRSSAGIPLGDFFRGQLGGGAQHDDMAYVRIAVAAEANYTSEPKVANLVDVTVAHGSMDKHPAANAPRRSKAETHPASGEVQLESSKGERILTHAAKEGLHPDGASRTGAMLTPTSPECLSKECTVTRLQCSNVTASSNTHMSFAVDIKRVLGDQA